jgi:hypothetical protein
VQIGIKGCDAKFFENSCAKPKSSAILTGSADENSSGFTRNLIGGGGRKDF